MSWCGRNMADLVATTKTVISENSQVADQPVPNVVHFALDQAVLS